ncbi:unnamed protein product [Clonostachys chloroleuca]|uniref:3-phytase n=1 Tax=Clonostachys chloroleuca TaxID=1926264 RepID=A0AA35LX48_9HYPO|nr:unnamed protein product [Clonostachys chloroleuca]
MTTLQPRPPYTDAELAELYPPQLQLQLVQILLRHGARTPVTPRFTGTGLPAYWSYCNAARHLRSAILEDDSGKFSSLEWKRRLEAFGPNDLPVFAAGPGGDLDAVCDMGMLTDLGRSTTTALGRRLRHLYIDRLGFLPPNLTSSESFYFRTTPIPRALESLQQTIHGLYPSHTRSPDLPPLTIVGRVPGEETLFPNDSNCRRFAALSRAFAQRTADRWNGSDEMAYLTKKIGRWMPEDSPRVAVDSHPRLSGIMDTINATDAHGPDTKLPKEFYDPRARQIIEDIAVEEWFSGYRESQEYRALGIGGLLGDIVTRMAGSAENPPAATAAAEHQPKKPSSSSSSRPPGIRFTMSGCHDTTLAGALASLGALEGGWPPFTSHIAFELFRHASAPAPSPSSASSSPTSWISSFFTRSGSSSAAAGIGRKKTPDLSPAEKQKLDGYYVRVRFNDKPVTIPACKAPGNHLEGDQSFCTLATFKAVVDKFTPENWREECHASGAPAFPSKPEPAGY